MSAKRKARRGKIMYAIPWRSYGRRAGPAHPLVVGSAWLLLPTKPTDDGVQPWTLDEQDIKDCVRVRVILEKP